MSRGLLLLALAGLVGCADQGVALRLFIGVAALVPDELDTVLVTISASSPEGRVCRARTGLFRLDAPDDLPLLVRLERGETYTEAVAFRIEGLLGEAPVLARREGLLEWPTEGVDDVEVQLEAACLVEALGADCGAEEHCVDEGCVGSPLPAAFGDLERLDDESCWRDE